MDVFNKLRTLLNTCVLHLQWTPSHGNLKYNDVADSLGKEGTTMPQAYVEALSYTQEERSLLTFLGGIHQLIHGIVVKAPVLLYVLREVRKDQTALARLSSGHLKILRFSRGDKKFNICTKRNMIEATLQHLFDCFALVYDDLLGV
ncbi:hypothetical protein AVEN_222018-1 [Araneus ventricosus]|uniref:Uncharacterized protein n=1 Tax=Araneus ventricosus TaxID=182803 RepID=A0A4Y2LJI0_ARAVE|nr:hypothetical protein AVEN_222018-1 [Araneus ventricosus]